MISINFINTSSIVSKVWAFCNTLRDDGVGSRNNRDRYGDYLEQLIECKHKPSTNRGVEAKYFKKGV